MSLVPHVSAFLSFHHTFCLPLLYLSTIKICAPYFKPSVPPSSWNLLFTPLCKPKISVPFSESPRHLVSSIQQISLIFDAYNMLSIYREWGGETCYIHPKVFSKTSYKIYKTDDGLHVSQSINIYQVDTVLIRSVLCASGKAVNDTDKPLSPSCRGDECYINWGHGEGVVSTAHQYSQGKVLEPGHLVWISYYLLVTWPWARMTRTELAM